MGKRFNLGRGFITYRDNGSRMTIRSAAGLSSIDLGSIRLDEAQKRAWLHGLVLIVNGRIHRRLA